MYSASAGNTKATTAASADECAGFALERVAGIGANRLRLAKHLLPPRISGDEFAGSANRDAEQYLVGKPQGKAITLKLRHVARRARPA